MTMITSFFGSMPGRGSHDLSNQGIHRSPGVNIRDDKDAYYLEMAAPGLQKDRLDIQVEGSLMTVAAKDDVHHKTDVADEGGYTIREFSYQTFKRSFSLPENADQDNITANYTDGIIQVTVPKKGDIPKAGQKRIKVK